jgi:serine/threonine-protein kinase
MLMIGTVVGNYRIIQQIGEGGMGAVYKGIDLMLEREVAIKALRPELARQPNIVERFRAEAVTLAKLNHPNIATLHSFFRQGDDYFMVMEFVRGETLDLMVRTRGAVSADRAVPLFCQALDGIDHAHRMGIVHRDIKPANMMLTEVGSIKVMDFGIARVLGSARMTREGHLIGTIEYMSPEQIRGQETDARSDIYSLGILLYEMLTGRVPFNSHSEYELMKSQIESAPPPPREFAPHISLPIEEAIMRALAKRPQSRFQTAAEFRTSLLNSMRAATKPGETHPIVVNTAPPPTRLSQPVAPAPLPVEPAQPHLQPGIASPSGPVAAGGPQLNPTRVAHPGEYQYAQPYAQPQAHYTNPQPYQAQPGDAWVAQQQSPVTASGSLLSRLNWKHYTAAGILLLVLVSTPFALLLMTNNSAVNQLPGQTQELTSPSGPASQQPAQQQQPQRNADEGTGSSASGLYPVDSKEGTGAKGGKGRDAGSDGATDVSDPKPPDPTETATTTPPPPQQTKPEERPKDRSTGEATPKETAKTDEKKDDKKKGVGGFFKKLGGIIKGDKNEEDKKKKKP